MYCKSTRMFRLGLNYYTRTCNRLLSNKVLENVTSVDGVVISDSCVQRIKQLCDNKDTFLRVSVESGGCSGFQYKFDLDNKISGDDRIFERGGVKLVIDETSLEYVKGSTIDYHTELIRSAFRVVSNPNSELGCSCGASFSVKID